MTIDQQQPRTEQEQTADERALAIVRENQRVYELARERQNRLAPALVNLLHVAMNHVENVDLTFENEHGEPETVRLLSNWASEDGRSMYLMFDNHATLVHFTSTVISSAEVRRITTERLSHMGHVMSATWSYTANDDLLHVNYCTQCGALVGISSRGVVRAGSMLLARCPGEQTNG